MPGHSVADTGLEFVNPSKPAAVRLFDGDDWSFDSEVRRAHRLSSQGSSTTGLIDGTGDSSRHGVGRSASIKMSDSTDRCGARRDTTASGDSYLNGDCAIDPFDHELAAQNIFARIGALLTGAATWLGCAAFIGGMILLILSFFEGQADFWSYGVPLTMLGQFILLGVIVVKLSGLTRTSRIVAKRVQLVDLRLRSLSESALLNRSV